MSQSALSERDRAFATNLDRLGVSADGRRALATLRRGVGGGTARFDAIRFLDRVVPRGATDSDLDTYALVAGLYAVYHQGRLSNTTTDGDLGDSFARLGGTPSWTPDRAARRLTPLLAASAATLRERLRHAAALLRSAAIPISWAVLARDIRGWDCEGHPVQRRWARSFVAGHAEESAGADPVTNQEGEDQ